MEREIKTTNDGSKTLFIKDLNEGYHSGHGALQEAKHVFIENGLKLVDNSIINILELGFGTGLNVLVTIDEFLKTDKYHEIDYYSVEKYPVTSDEIASLDYPKLFEEPKMEEVFLKMHSAPWNEPTELIPGFFLTKVLGDFLLLDTYSIPKVDLVYFDCFGARVQPDLWELPLLKQVESNMSPSALFSTYASKGSLRRHLESLDLSVEKRPGPPGKREMITARKNEPLN